ncbi:sodium/hydrogen exchanger 3 [Quercus suber]|uniref:Sodium/hydrogen exchanger 3 n=1 Tax=Quercus suber TaxID=58331 RepID=A0AAW0J3Y8_QUESU
MAVLETIPVLLSSSSSSSFLDTSTVIALTVFFALLCACIIIGHLLEENRWANESITALLLGLCCGVVVLLISKFQSSRILVFSEDLFFLYLLPPIIFNAGFQVKKKRFFKNFTTILLFGVVGTVISFCLISLGAYLLFKRIGVTSLDIQDYLAVGAILSATDSVCTLQVLNQDETPLLYSIVFGEGVVNDATSIVLFNAVQSLDVSNIDLLTALKLLGTFLYLFFTSTVLGIAAGLISAYIIKTLYFGSPGTSIAVSSTLFALVLVGRAAFVFPIANITNWIKKRPTIAIDSSSSFANHLKSQFIIWWAGLMRGAVTIALSYNKFANSNKTLTEDSALMITSTIIVVLFSTVVFGSITKPLIEAMLLRNAKPVHSDATDIPSLDDLQILFLENCDPSEGGSNEPARRKGSLSLLISNPTSTVHYFWRKFDDKFMRPVFGGRGFVPFVPSSPSGAADPQTS